MKIAPIGLKYSLFTFGVNVLCSNGSCRYVLGESRPPYFSPACFVNTYFFRSTYFVSAATIAKRQIDTRQKLQHPLWWCRWYRHVPRRISICWIIPVRVDCGRRRMSWCPQSTETFLARYTRFILPTGGPSFRGPYCVDLVGPLLSSAHLSLFSHF